MSSPTQREFMDRWGMISFGSPDDAPFNYETAVNPKSGYKNAHDGTFYRFSGVKNWYRPALWWEHLIAISWGRLFWFQPREWKHRWVVSLCDHAMWGIEIRQYRTKFVARIAALFWLVKLGRGTLYAAPYHLELHDMYRECAVSRGWPLYEGRR